mgnify:CR=1 FL=1
MSQNEQLESKLSKLGISGGTPNTVYAPKLDQFSQAKAGIFLDEFGHQTFYVRNIGPRPVSISGLGIKVASNDVEDLLQFKSIEEVQKDQGLRTALNIGKSLVRISKEEYLHLLAKKEEGELIRAQQLQDLSNRKVTAVNPEDIKISSLVMNQVTKAQMYYSPDAAVAALGTLPYDFKEWAIVANLTIAEMDYIANAVPDKEVKAAMFKRKSEAVSGA